MFDIQNIRLIAPEIIFILFALIILLLDLVIKQKEGIAIAGLGGIIISGYINFRLINLGWLGSSFQGMFVFDGYSNIFKLIFYINLVLTILLSIRYMKIEGASLGEYYSLLFFATSGMMLMAGAVDLIVIYLGLELMALSTYILAGIVRRQVRSQESALKYFFLGAFSSAFLLYGIALIYGLTGTTNLKEIASSLHNLNLLQNPITLLGIIFFIVALGFKVALVPFHMWAPDVYEGAPTSVTSFMSVGPKAAGFAVIGRLFLDAFGELHIEWSSILIPLSILTMAVGSIIALSQRNIKRMLAYSSIAHAGYAMLGIITGTNEGLVSTLNYLMIYAFMNIGAFSIVILLRGESILGESLDDYAGLSKEHPIISALMLIFMFSLTGIPPTAGFIAKFYVFMEAIYAGYTPLVIIAVIFSVISAFFYLRVVMYMYMKEPGERVEPSMSRGVAIALIITSAAVLTLGIFPSFLLNYIRSTIMG
ncbi:MAG: NADH-quinone oxidoreductase subunit N [Thermodesulfovibrionia bacterium]